MEQDEAGDPFLPRPKVVCPGIPWGLSRLDQPDLPLDRIFNPQNLWGKDVLIFILDTGVREHSDLVGRLESGANCLSRSCQRGNSKDVDGHGTHVAGTAAGSCYGVAKGATIVPVKVLGDNGSGSNSGVLAGIQWAIQQTKNSKKRGVINLSLGGPYSSAFNSAIKEATDAGLVVAVAAGNDNAADACSRSPASAPSAITAAASTSSDRAASFSNVGKCVDIWAPGYRIASANVNDFDGYAVLSGTSMATPHVAGAAALYLQMFPSASPSQVASGLAKASVKRDMYPQTTRNLLQAYRAAFK